MTSDRDEPITEPLREGDAVRLSVAATVAIVAPGAILVEVQPRSVLIPTDDIPSKLRRIVPNWTPHPTGTLLKDPEGRLWSVGGNGPMVLIATHMTHPLYAVRSQSYESSQWTVLFTPPPDEVREWS